MGQQNDSHRNASLDEHKQRAAGRQNSPGSQRESLQNNEAARGATRGAFGRKGEANPPVTGGTMAGGGGGGADSKARDADVPASKRPARKRS